MMDRMMQCGQFFTSFSCFGFCFGIRFGLFVYLFISLRLLLLLSYLNVCALLFSALITVVRIGWFKIPNIPFDRIEDGQSQQCKFDIDREYLAHVA